MADLLDIAPATAAEVVRIGDHRQVVRGITIDTMASIVARFPEVRAIASGAANADIVSLLISGCGKAIGPIIAAACGYPNDAEREERASKLLPEHQVRFLRVIAGLTFPNGIGPFVEELTLLMGGTGPAEKPVRVRLKKSPSPLPPSSDEDSRPTMQ